MGPTYLKRQKEMKRLEKQRMKAENRAKRKIAKHAESEAAVQQPDGLRESQGSQVLQVPGGENQSEAG
jgi:hypothetical protein